MKKIVFHSVIALMLFATSCQEEIAPGEPACIREKIIEFSDIGICETGKSVAKYKFQGEFVYVFNHGTCGADFQSPVYDANCTSLGYLGGITGNDEINSVSFCLNAEFVSLVWKD